MVTNCLTRAIILGDNECSYHQAMLDVMGITLQAMYCHPIEREKKKKNPLQTLSNLIKPNKYAKLPTHCLICGGSAPLTLMPNMVRTTLPLMPNRVLELHIMNLVIIVERARVMEAVSHTLP